LSGDAALIQDYLTDPYLGFAKRIGQAPPDATKRSHEAICDAMKLVCLGINCGPRTLDRSGGAPAATPHGSRFR
jgi:hypothetical protein